MSAITTPQHGAAALTETFRRRNESGGKVLVTYIMAGDPDIETTGEIIKTLSQCGVDIIELGMPFTDPLADGPVIQNAGQRALKQNLTLKKLLAAIREWRNSVNTPFVIMTYYNLFFRYGMDTFAEEASKAGLDGVIVPDLPIEEADELHDSLEKFGLALIPLIAPTSTEERIAAICQKANGFVYYVSRTGVTGMQNDLATDMQENLANIRKNTDLPIGVGFGISNSEQAKQVAHIADGVVIGSAIVRLIEESGKNALEPIHKFSQPIIEVLHNVQSETN